MSGTLSVEERLGIIERRVARVQMSITVARETAVAAGLDACASGGLTQIVDEDTPWMVDQLKRLLREHAADGRRIAQLQNELGETQAKVRRQAGALTAAQAAEGRRVARGRRP